MFCVRACGVTASSDYNVCVCGVVFDLHCVVVIAVCAVVFVYVCMCVLCVCVRACVRACMHACLWDLVRLHSRLPSCCVPI